MSTQAPREVPPLLIISVTNLVDLFEISSCGISSLDERLAVVVYGTNEQSERKHITTLTRVGQCRTLYLRRNKI